MLFDFPSGGFIRLQKWGLALHWEGLGFYCGWFTDIDFVVLHVTLFEWWPDDSHLVPFRIQILYFLLSLHLDQG